MALYGSVYGRDCLTAGLHWAVLQMLVLREFFSEEAALNAVSC